MRNISNDDAGRVKVSAEYPFRETNELDCVVELGFDAVVELRLGDVEETDLLADVLVSAAHLLGLIWLWARGIEAVARRSDWPGDRLGLRRVGPEFYMSGAGCEA